MTSSAHTPDGGPAETRIAALEVAGLRLLGAWLLAWSMVDGVYVLAQFFVARYPDLAYVPWVLAEVCVGWTLATRAPRIARWLRARTRVDLPA